MHLDFRLLRQLDKWLVFAVTALTLFGIVVISSAAIGFVGAEGARSFVNKQIIAAVIGLMGVTAIMLVDYSDFGRMSKLLYGLNAGLLVLVLALGTVTNGAQSWIELGPLSFQPSEVGKVLFILTLGNQLAHMEQVTSFWHLIPPALHALPLFALIILQNDLGTVLVFIIITAAMVYMAGYSGLKLLLMGGTPIAAVAGWTLAHMHYGVSMWPLQDYQIKRLLNFIDPTHDPLGSGYQVLQSKIALGSGGLWGKGLYQGTQNQLGFLPEQHTDFIFAVVVEELGFVGGAFVVLLFLILFYRLLVISAEAKDKYGALIAVGVMAMLGFHVVENIGMTMGVMPVTGIPLPFVSYGGSSLMTNLLAVGLVLNVGMRRQSIMFR